MKLLIKAFFILTSVPLIFAGLLTRTKIQEETRESMSEEGKANFDKHTEAIAKLVNLSSTLNNVKVTKNDEQNLIKLTPMENPTMYQGDVILTESQAGYLIEEAKLKLEAKKAGKTENDTELEIIERLKIIRAYKNDSYYTWDLPIPYYIETGLEEAIIDNAIKNIEKETCITFMKSAPFNDRQGLRIFRGQGCYSYIGPVFEDKPQDVSIGQGCAWNGIIQHEICHALGLFHEQSRPDRENYLYINISNVLPYERFNYEKSSIAETDTFGIPFDYGSDMQYDKKAFSYNGKLTMIPKNPLYLNTIGQFDKLQFNDVKLVNSIYCAGQCQGSIECLNGGYEDPKICGKCKCPSMLGGKYCSEVAKNPSECGINNILQASKEIKSFSIRGNKNCVFLIQGDKGKRIQFNIDKANFISTERCFPGIALEVKFNIDKTITGPTFCGYVYNKGLSSEANEILFHYVGISNDHFLEIRYRQL